MLMDFTSLCHFEMLYISILNIVSQLWYEIHFCVYIAQKLVILVHTYMFIHMYITMTNYLRYR